MKNLIFLFAFALVGLECFAQKGPIQPYRTDGYTIPMIKDFIGENDPLAVNYRVELLRIVNNGLKQSGEASSLDNGNPLTEANLHWILDQVVFEQRSYATFTNSRREGDKIVFYTDRSFTGMVGIFKFGKCTLPIFKAICMNLIEVPVEITIDVNGNYQQQVTNTAGTTTGTAAGQTININVNCCGGQAQQPVQQQDQGYMVSSGVGFYPQQTYYYQPQPMYPQCGYSQPQSYSVSGGMDYYPRQPRTVQSAPHGTGSDGRSTIHGTGGGGRGSGSGNGNSGGGRGTGSSGNGGTGGGGRH